MSNVAAGWYDDGSGRQRWWDGTKWTEQFQEEVTPTQVVPPRDPNVLWEAVGKPITGIGAGRYKLTKDLLYFEKGALSTRAQQIQTWEIHDVDASQSMTQKARGVGNIVLTAMRASGREAVVLEDVPNFREGVQAINQAAHEAREAHRVKQQTSHVNYQGFPATQPSPVAGSAPTPATSSGSDLNAELAKLAAFKAEGLLTEEEFTAAKRKLLGL
jgi:hypothetical protein